MSASIVLWLVLAIVIFWAYGLNSRLGRMRVRSIDAMGSLEKHMRQYSVLIHGHVKTSEEDLPVRWQRVIDLLQTLESELKDMKSVPLSGTNLAHLWRSFEALQTAWTSLVKAPIDVAGIVVSDSLREDWEATTFKVLSARSGVNGILEKYNEAVMQIPARWLARLLGHVPVGQLQ